ncbi:hypothetical protein CCR94_23600 [Rhodoblastus sphagnicola]|uniref:MaoC-like domain-containing protein n=1 Tax=Rhodoblastus sphagnicola TaxID=333368 RepID=A0A2S6MUH2_9HYPH|nr:hypothetical protein [Rhodoblastus sphagnicola]MBB4196976.1 hypothetical protein [Rhodoblastus sphagnicola]PPQ26013.1 hypothetical protein CCR94_23600 [Rhodoblastus sphagnicola]
MTGAPTVQRAGPLRVTTAKEAVRAFRRETGWRDEDGAVPLSFPVVWMKSPEIGEPIRAAAQEIGLPVHEAQNFDYFEPLQLDKAYDLMLELRREMDPPRLIATAEIHAVDGSIVGSVVSTLRLIDPAAIPVSEAPV